ncbi:MAG: calcium-binding protein [Aquisalinus sp.]|nr:calcium-binding protein [Aquisalinus sp.]
MPYDSLEAEEQFAGQSTDLSEAISVFCGCMLNAHDPNDGHNHSFEQSSFSFDSGMQGSGIAVSGDGGILGISAADLAEAIGSVSDGFQNALEFGLNVVDLTGTATAETLALFETIAGQALDTWGQFIDAAEGASLEVTLNVGGTNAVASAGPGTFAISNSFDLNESGALDEGDFLLLEAGSLFELRTGIDVNGADTDIVINVNPAFIESGQFFFDPELDDPVPADQFDFFSVLLHELAHGLGFLGIRDTQNPFDLPLFDLANLGLDPGLVTIGTPYDLLIDVTEEGAPVFNGQLSAAAYGEALPLEFQTGSSGSDLSHFLGTGGDIALALMNPFVIPGDRVEIGQLELNLLADIGMPIINSDQVPFINRFDQLPEELEPTFFFGGITGLAENALSFSVNLTSVPPFVSLPSSVGFGVATQAGEFSQRLSLTNPETEANFSIALSEIFGEDVSAFVGTVSGTLDIRLFNPAQATLVDGVSEDLTVLALTFVGGDEGRERITAGDDINIIFSRGGNDRIETGVADDFIDSGDGNDRVTSGDGDDSITTGAGNDRVDAGAGNNQIDTAAGNDRVFAADGDNQIDTGTENDRIELGNGANFVLTGDGKDRVIVGNGDNQIDTGTENDRVEAGDGANFVLTGDGRDRVTVGNGDNQIDTGAERDRVDAGDGNNLIVSGDGNDRVTVGNGDNQIDTGVGNDRVEVGDGNNVILTGLGNDLVFAGNGNNEIVGDAGKDRIFTGEGSDVIFGDADNDRIFSGAGADILFGGTGNDRLSGEDGDDILIGDEGFDNLFGGAGADVFIINAGTERDTIRDFSSEEGDTIDVSSFGEAFDTFEEIIAAATQRGNHTIIDFGNGDELVIRSTQLDTLTAEDFIAVIPGF